MPNSRITVIAVAIVAIAVGGVGLELAGGSSNSRSEEREKPDKQDDRIAYTPRRMTGVARPTRDPAEVLAEVLGRYGGSRVVSASAERSPDGTKIHFVVSAPTLEDGQPVRGQWESDLVEGAVADVLAGGANHVQTSRIEVRLPDGGTTEMGGGMGHIVPNQQFSGANDEVIRNAITEGLAERDLELESLEILRALQPAPAVIATTEDPEAAARLANETINSLFGTDPATYEGYFFEVRDRFGATLFVQSASFRTGNGRGWMSPRVEDVISLNR